MASCAWRNGVPRLRGDDPCEVDFRPILESQVGAEQQPHLAIGRTRDRYRRRSALEGLDLPLARLLAASRVGDVAEHDGLCTACGLASDVDAHPQVGAVADGKRFDSGRTGLDPDAPSASPIVPASSPVRPSHVAVDPCAAAPHPRATRNPESPAWPRSRCSRCRMRFKPVSRPKSQGDSVVDRVVEHLFGSPEASASRPGPRVHRSLQSGHVAPVPSRGNAPRNSSPNRTEADR